MAGRTILYLALAALLVSLAASQTPNSCAGPTAPAKFRYLYIADVQDDKPDHVKAMQTHHENWLKGCAGLIVREGHGAALTQDPSMFGLKSLPKNSYMGDFGAWMDVRSLEDLHECVARGLKDGNVTAVRRLALRGARIVFALNTTNGAVATVKTHQDCSDRSFAPAKVRMMIAYVLKDPATAGEAIALQRKVTAAATTKPIRFGTGGSAALGKDEYVWGPGITKTADWGVWYDFVNEADLRAYFSPTDTSHAPRMQLRGLSSSAMRIAIPLA